MEAFKIEMPPGAQKIINTLCRDGFEAYLVGGCVRDSLLGKIPKDWDICTNATPAEVERCFPEFRIIETGIQHGTVTILVNEESYEVTTFRTDGAYSDHRHPDEVKFTGSIEEDLARRDFTMNAIAYSPQRGLVDPYCGMYDLACGSIRCVGNPVERFQEDALRIMRALRFSSTYGFTMSTYTYQAAIDNLDILQHVAKERIRDELCKLVLGKDFLGSMHRYYPILGFVIPEFNPCVGFKQHNPFHKYDVLEHIFHAVSAYRGDDLTVKLALLFHDIGKPQCFTKDEKGGHFYGHAVVSSQIAERILDRLLFDSHTKEDVLELIDHHDADLKPTYSSARGWLNKLGEMQLRRMIEVKLADIVAQSALSSQRANELGMFSKIVDDVIDKDQCFKITDLHIDGNDIMNFGVLEGPEVGEILRWLLNEVIEGRLPNKHHDLIQAADLEIYRRSGNTEE